MNDDRSHNRATSRTGAGPCGNPGKAPPSSTAQQPQRTAALAERADHLARANKQLRKLLAKRRKAEKKASEQMYELVVRNEQLEDRLRKYQTTEKALKDELSALRHNRDELLKQLRQNKADRKLVAAELAASRNRLNAQIRDSQRTETQLRRRIAELASANQRLEAELAEYKHLEASGLHRWSSGTAGPPAALVGPPRKRPQSSIADLVTWPTGEPAGPDAAPTSLNREAEQPPACNADPPAGPRSRAVPLVLGNKVVLAAAVAVIAALSVALFKATLLNRHSGARAWGPAMPLSLSGTNTRSIGLVTGIVFNHQRSTAMVGNRIVHEGDVIRHVKVTRIYRDRVEFEANGRKWTQRLFELPAVDWQTTISAPGEP